MARQPGGTSRVTTAPAATTEPEPMVTPFKMVALAPMKHPSPMTDSGIEEIYTMVEQALVHGQKNVPVQIYPFVPTPARLSEEKDTPHAAFWADMARAWDWTERTRTPAWVKAVNGRLVVVEQ